MLLIAHRGASGYAPENTLAAFRLALDLGARAVELDIHQTRDGELVVIHDDDLKRVGRLKARIAELSAGELAAVDVGSWFSPRFASERAPTLSQAMDLVAGRAELHVELKHGSRRYPGIERRLVELIERRAAWKETLISSFDHPALFAVRALDKRARIGYLLGLTGMRKAYREMRALGAESLNLSLRQAGADLARKLHARGLKGLVYTVNTREQLSRVASRGYDGAFTNFPDLKP
ncbi:MAG: hypothetical protein KGO96_01385 [Elusimicrobia bacterium]|nr:hypothetical protein [Elusimicrobiota bacterium]MDE2424548.1 hypothetical protein [Elusimicrobiota bacterium]